MLIRKVLSSSIRYRIAYDFATDAKTLKIGVPKEVYANEKRVAITPETIERMTKKNGVQFLIESGAGQGASIPDERYVASGAKIVSA
jgi:alanine dehydrogenase